MSHRRALSAAGERISHDTRGTPPGTAGTRACKDWHGAATHRSQVQRSERRRAKRCASDPALLATLNLPEQHKVGPVDPLAPRKARGPMAPRFAGSGEETFSYCIEERAREVYRKLDEAGGSRDGLNAITMEDLRHSFNIIHSRNPRLVIDSNTFERYVVMMLPPNVTEDGISLNEFLDFHKRIWESQPVPMRKETSRLREIRNSENLARSAFESYDNDASGWLSHQELPALLCDLGLELDNISDKSRADRFVGSQFIRADLNKDEKVSFNEFVKFQNTFIDTLNFSKATKKAMSDEAIDIGKMFRNTKMNDFKAMQKR